MNPCVPSIRERLLLISLQIAMAAHFALTYVMLHNDFLPLKTYADGGVMLPYQARVLVAWIMRYATKLSIVQELSHHMPGSDRLKDPYEFCFLVIAFLCMFGSIRVTQNSIAFFTGDDRYSGWSSFLVWYMSIFNLLLAYSLTYRLPYDLPSLFFFCLGIYLILKRRILLFYPIFVLATLNRETSCFLVLFFILYEIVYQIKKSLIAIHAAAMTVVWISIKVWLTHRFRNNPTEVGNNGVATWHLSQNIHFLFNPGQWPQLLSVCGFGLVFVAFFFREIPARSLRIAVISIIPLWISVMMLTGVLIEIRIFTELSALLSLAVATTVFQKYYATSAP